LKGNPLPASFEIVFKDMKINQIDPKKMKEYSEKIKGVEEVEHADSGWSNLRAP
jgi:cell division protein FtsX